MGSPAQPAPRGGEARQIRRKPRDRTPAVSQCKRIQHSITPMPKRRADTALKVARKTTRGDAPTATANTVGHFVDRPLSLTGRAAEIWDQHAPELVREGMLTPRDALMFATWCRLGEKLEDGGLTPALVTQFRLIGNDFGLSPSGKGREITPPVPPTKNKFFRD